MPGDAQDTRRKILEAATEEFARHGLAGARVDRITRRAGVNNALLYRYFGSKLELFDRVFSDLIEQLVRGVPLDSDDPLGYVGRLFDYNVNHPQIVRLAAWRELERPDLDVADAVSDVHRANARSIASAQADGRISNALGADELLDLMVLLSMSASPLTARLAPNVDPERRRAAVLAAAEAILRVE